MPKKRATRRPPDPLPSRGTTAKLPSIIDFLERHAGPAAILLVVFATLRIVSTYTVFSHTFDEPAHIAAGMEWLDRHAYTYEPKHPPLARVASALGPYLLGIRSQGVAAGNPSKMTQEGTAILYRDRHYDRTLAFSRVGMLPFFWAACLVMYVWGKRFFGRMAALSAVFLFSFLPPILAHAGLSTTDVAVMAFVGAAFVAALVCVDTPSLRSGALFGTCCGLALVSKLSALVFLPACLGFALVFYLAAERPKPADLVFRIKRLLPAIGMALLAGALVIWAMYRFSFGQTPFGLRLPAPEFFAGIQQAWEHGQRGNRSYMFGERSTRGFWYFFPVALSVKTPLGFLLLLVSGVFLVFRKQFPKRRPWLPLAFAGGILLVGMISTINIGVRHILAIYMGFSMIAAVAIQQLLELSQSRKWPGALLAVALLWFAGSSLRSHPDYIPYFNELAGEHPENIEVDSDLDWGQDIKRLSKRLREVGAAEVTYNQFIIADLEREHGFPPIREMNLASPSPGWNAADLTYLKLCRLGLFDTYPDLKLWPDYIPPTEMAGKSIRLWFVPYPR